MDEARDGPIFVRYSLHLFVIVCLSVSILFSCLFCLDIHYLQCGYLTLFYCTPVTFNIIIVDIKTVIIIISVCKCDILFKYFIICLKISFRSLKIGVVLVFFTIDI